jgi:hypothetical protein
VPTLRLVYDVPGWAYHHNATGLERYAPADFEVSSSPLRLGGPLLDWDTILGDTPVDLLFLFDFTRTAFLRAELTRRGWDTALMVAWSVGWPRAAPQFPETYCLADAMLVSNREYWERAGRLPGTYAIPYGVDGAVFDVRVPPAARRPRVLWVGSAVARQVKGYDDYVLPLMAALRARGIETEALLVDSFGAKRSPEEMAAWYNSGTVIVCASEAEGTPNPPLEAAACGCTIVSTRVGNMPELIRDGENGFLVDRRADALLEGALAAVRDYPRLAARMQRDIVPWLWSHRSPEYYAAFREVLGSPPDAPAAVRRKSADLSGKVTVFVTTVGGPTFGDCVDRLCRQDVKFKLEVIAHVTPLSAALQRMLDGCETPYYVQVDEDMLLYPHAVRTLVEALEAEPPDVAMYVGNLYDVHLDRAIQGVKISRHLLARRFPWSETPSVLERNARIVASGLRITATRTEGLPPTAPSVLGLHGTAWTPETIFGRYFTLESWRRAYPGTIGWFGRHPAGLLARFLAEPTELNYLALMGVVCAALDPCAPPVEKDAARAGTLPGLAASRRLFAELTAGGPGQGPLAEAGP